MVEKQMVGRLGNQMFQYATIRAVQELNGDKDGIEVSFKKYVEARGYKNELSDFQIKEIVEVDKISKSLIQSILIFCTKSIEKILMHCVSSKNFEYKRYL